MLVAAHCVHHYDLLTIIAVLCSATPEDKAAIKEYLGVDGSDIAWDLIRAAMQSVSGTSIFMMQVCV